MTDEAQSLLDSMPPARRWWQLLLIYPSLGIAFLSATPVLADKALAFYHGTNTESYSAATKQRDMWTKNLQCSASPFAWYSNPANIKVDASICPSGDIFVRVMTPDSKSFYHWLPLDEIVRTDAAPGGGLVPSAKAETAPAGSPPAASAGRAGEMKLAMQEARVICQHMVDGRILVRRIQTPQGCFDEYVDTLNGAVIRRNAAPCSPQC